MHLSDIVIIMNIVCLFMMGCRRVRVCPHGEEPAPWNWKQCAVLFNPTRTLILPLIIKDTIRLASHGKKDFLVT